MKHNQIYNDMLQHLNNLALRCEFDHLIVQARYARRAAEYGQVEQAATQRADTLRAGNNQASVKEDKMLQALDDKKDFLDQQLQQDTHILTVLKQSQKKIEALITFCGRTQSFAEIANEITRTKNALISEENLMTLSQRSKGFTVLEKIVAALNKIFTKAIGEKNLNTIERTLNKAHSVASKLNSQGFFQIGGKTQPNISSGPKNN